MKIRGMHEVDEDVHDALLSLDADDKVKLDTWKSPLTIRETGLARKRMNGSVRVYDASGHGGAYRIRVRIDRSAVTIIRLPSKRSPGVDYVDFDSIEVVES